MSDEQAISQPERHCQVVVIGGSAGAIAALGRILCELNRSFPAPILVALHSSADSPRLLPDVLGKHTPLVVRYAEDSGEIEPGHIYIAPPNRHLLVSEGVLRVTRGPRENRSRPAIDPLFRTAARWYGPRLAGVLLSGFLNDGTYGLAVVKHEGGRTIVQSPADADNPDMPSGAIRKVQVDDILTATEIGKLLGQIAIEPKKEVRSMSRKLQHFDPVDGVRTGSTLQPPPNGDLVPFVCPDCGGAMWELRHLNVLRYSCHVGHSYAVDVLINAQEENIENALWAALRALEEKAELARRLMERARAANGSPSADRYEESVSEIEQQASTIHAMIMSADRSTVSAAVETEPLQRSASRENPAERSRPS